MLRSVRLLGAVVALALAPAVAPGQQARSGEPVVVSTTPGTRIVHPATRLATAPPAGTVRTIRPASVPGTIPAGAVVVSAGSGGTVQTLLTGDVPVPGLGFDYAHHTAVNRSLDTLALVDPLTQHRLALARQIRQEMPRFTLLPVFSQVTQVFVQAPPPVIVMQPAAEPPVERVERVRYVEPVVAPPAPAPVRELGELVLVLRDGSERLARAFTVNAARILYISPEGLRRTLPLEELDVEATLAANEERGTLLHLPR